MKIFSVGLLLLFTLTTHINVYGEDLNESEFEMLAEKSDDKSMPLVNITTDFAAVNGSEYTPATIEIFDLKKRTAGQPLAKYSCKVKYRGASSQQYEKKSFAVKLLDAEGEDLDAGIFGIREENDWILDAMAIDRIRMRNRVCFDFWNEINKLPYETDFGKRNGTNGVFVEVFINGSYHGLYCMTDKIDRKLLGLKKAKEGDDGSVTIRGLLYKGSEWTGAVQLLSYDKEAPTNTDTWEGYELQYPDDYPSLATWQPLMDWIDFLHTTNTDFIGNYTEHLNTENLSDYAMLFAFFNYDDAPMKNTFLSTVNITEGHQFIITPWDMDMSLGGNYDGAYNETYFSGDLFTSHYLFKMLYGNNVDGFKDDIKRKYGDFCNGILSKENFNKHIDTYAELFTESGAWKREYDRWNNNPVALHEDIQDEMRYVKDWYAANQEHVKSIFGLSSGISKPAYSEQKQSSRAYNINGTPVSNTSKCSGIIIKCGKKFLLK